MRAALVFGQRVQLVHDDEPAGGQRRVVSRLAEQDREALRCGQEQVRRTAADARALRGRGVTGAQSYADPGFQTHFAQRSGEVFLDVVCQRAQRRNINGMDAPRRRYVAYKPVDDAEEAGKRLAAPRRRREQDRLTFEDRRDAEALRGGEVAIRAEEPRADERIEPRGEPGVQLGRRGIEVIGERHGFS